MAWTKRVRPAFPDLRPGAWRYYAVALLALFGLYSLALWATFGRGLGWAMADAIPPVAAVALTGPILRLLLLRLIFRIDPPGQAVAHMASALVFTVVLYWLNQVLIGVAISRDPVRFAPPDFFAPAAAWQMVQGVALYALIALSAYIEGLRARQQPVAAEPSRPEASPRLFVKRDEEFRPIDPARIILARGADDYAEIETAAGRHLVRMTLSALGEKLGPGFIRIHRSCLVNVSHIGKAEPAGGGRMLLHMDNGARISTSRSGARLLRERIV
ncbi:MAG TPA: LytTR family DNA-binding domain-containing protein [Phenylobacterium sp.]|nr:LytTR family DNA-binding domain-containing protein [Phenylobacterium sp.]